MQECYREFVVRSNLFGRLPRPSDGQTQDPEGIVDPNIPKLGVENSCILLYFTHEEVSINVFSLFFFFVSLIVGWVPNVIVWRANFCQPQIASPIGQLDSLDNDEVMVARQKPLQKRKKKGKTTYTHLFSYRSLSVWN